MNDVVGETGELRMVIEVTRKDTGIVERHELVSIVSKEDAEALGIDTGNAPKED